MYHFKTRGLIVFMQIGIVGLPTSGKTTVFNTLTGSHAETSIAGFGKRDPNRGVVHVPDPRLDRLAEMYSPKKVTTATIELTDVAGLAKGSTADAGFTGEFLGHLRDMEALLIVVRVFEASSVPHPEVSIDAARDLDTVRTELCLADLNIIEKRLERVKKDVQRVTEKRKALETEIVSLERFMKFLEDGQPILSAEPTADEIRNYIRPYGLLSGKKILVLANVGDLSSAAEQGRMQALKEAANDLELVVMNPQLEIDLQELPVEEHADYYESSGLDGSAKGDVIRACYRALNQISFLTAGEPEVRAWTIGLDTPAAEAAGKIHSDIQRGFIRAEVTAYDDLIECGSEQAAKKAGKHRLEGREYIVQDGDVILFRFSV